MLNKQNKTAVTSPPWEKQTSKKKLKLTTTKNILKNVGEHGDESNSKERVWTQK